MKTRPIARHLVAIALALARIVAGQDAPKPKLVAGPTCPVVRVADGDTIVVKLDGVSTTICLIGVDTPETVASGQPVERFGKEATAFYRETLEGEQVRLENEPASRKTDRYDRTLAHVTTEPGDEQVNLAIVEKGFGHAYTSKPFSMIERFRKAEREAREGKRGLWGDDPIKAEVKPEVGKGTAVVYLTDKGKKYTREGCRYLAKSSRATTLGEVLAYFEACSICAPPGRLAGQGGYRGVIGLWRRGLVGSAPGSPWVG